MAQNPYLNTPPPPPPRRPYRLVVRPTGLVIEVDPEQLPDEEGLRGSVLSLLLAHGVELDHSCGGVCACATCHVYVVEGGGTAPGATEAEEDQLDFAPALKATSRLACQCVPDGSADVVVELPAWKRNEVSEGH